MKQENMEIGNRVEEEGSKISIGGERMEIA